MRLDKEAIIQVVPSIVSQFKRCLLSNLGQRRLVSSYVKHGRGKSPGITHLPSESYKEIWPAIAEGLLHLSLDLIEASINPGWLVIKLIPKGSNRELDGGWRYLAFQDESFLKHLLLKHFCKWLGDSPSYFLACQLFQSCFSIFFIDRYI